jgi:hypothetical protein
MTPQQEAANAWQDHFAKRWDIQSPRQLGYQAIEDYKASLRAKLDDLKQDPLFVIKNPMDYDYQLVERARKEVNMYNEFEKLIDTVKPLK